MHRMHYPLHESPPLTLPKLVSVGAWNAVRGRDFPPHRHTVWEVVYYRAGHIRCPLGDQVFAGQPGVVLATPPGVTHAEIALTAYANFWAQIEAPPETPWPLHALDDVDQSLGHVISALVREDIARREGPSDHQAMIGLLLAQLDLLLRRAAASPPVEDAELTVRRAERLMDERCAGITVHDGEDGATSALTGIAREVGVAPSTLRAYFAACRGISPRDCWQAIRVRRAVALLRTSTLTLEAVAHLCGYDSASHLSRHVKRATGDSPGALRRRRA